MLLTETLWAIGAVLILIHRDCLSRFIRGFGAEPYLREYLILYGVRMAALWLADSRAAVGRIRHTMGGG